jgi:ATP-binding cassette subfamily C (CFTR/MRP) protein 1
VSIAAAVLQLVSALAIVFLAIFEYPRTTRSSRTTTTYLLSAVATDCVLMRTLYMRDYIPKIGPVVSAAAVCKLLLFLLESWPKASSLKPTDEPFGPVDVASPINRAFLFWLNRLLFYGYGHILSLSDLYPLDQDLYSERLRVRMQHYWDKCMFTMIIPRLYTMIVLTFTFKDKTKETYPMIWAGVACLKWNLLVTVPPRAGMIAISYAQTFLINDAISYLETPAPLRDVRHAYGLIGAAAIIYVGTTVGKLSATFDRDINILQVLNTNYLYKVFRMITTFRGSTASLIYGKSLSADANHNQMAAITLMSTDVDRIGTKELLFYAACSYTDISRRSYQFGSTSRAMGPDHSDSYWNLASLETTRTYFDCSDITCSHMLLWSIKACSTNGS